MGPTLIFTDEPSYPTVVIPPSKVRYDCGQGGGYNSLVKCESDFHEQHKNLHTWSKAAKNVLHIKPKNTIPKRFFGTICSSSFFHDAPGLCLASLTGDDGSAVVVILWESRHSKALRVDFKNGLDSVNREREKGKWVHD